MMKTPVIYYGAIAAFCVLTLCIGMVNAAHMTHPATNWTDKPGMGHGHTPAPDEMIAHLEQQGVDVNEVKTLLQNGDTTAVKIWLEANRPAHAGFPTGSAHPGFDLTNVTMQQQMITRFEQQGTDISGLQAAFQSRDTTAVKAWLDTYRDSHKDQMNNCRMNRKPRARETT